MKPRFTGEYRSWSDMKQRCCNSKRPQFRWYGARGIKVCDRWMNSFDAFLEDMGHKPSPRHSLGRIDNDGDYCPENCRWETPREQMRNTRRAVRATVNGETDTLSGWADRLNVNASIFRQRVANGWTAEDAVITPPNRPNPSRRDCLTPLQAGVLSALCRYIDANGQSPMYLEIAAAAGIEGRSRKQLVQGALEGLEARGLVERTRKYAFRNWRPTPRGREVAA